MAHIIQFTNSAPTQVQQQGRPGRHPKMVVNLYHFRRDKNIACSKANENQKEMESLCGVIKTCSQVIHNARYELAVRAQSMAKGQS